MISFVGAGPGAADLITLRGAQRLAVADVVVWASSLVPEAVLTHAAPSAGVYDSASMTLEDVLALYASHPSADIVRLHSGDPSVYGAIQEQIDWCHANNREFEIVPGVSSLGAAAAAIGRELTIPQLSQSVVLTRLAGRTAASMPARESVTAFARHRATMAVFLSAARPAELQAELLAAGEGYPPQTPVAIVIRASWPDQRVVRTTVGDLAEALDASGVTMTTLVLVGPAVGTAVGPAVGPLVGPAVGTPAEETAARSHLYSPDYTHTYRKRSLPGTTVGRPSARADRGGA